MEKPFAAFDVDGTTFKSSLVEKAVEGFIEAGIFNADRFNEVYERKEQWQIDNNEGVYQSYLNRLVGAFVEQIAGVEVQHFERIMTGVIDRHAVRKFGFTRQLMNAIQDTHTIIAISGSPDIMVKPFMNDLPVEQTYGSWFGVSGGTFTGEAAPVGDKAEILQRLVEEDQVLRMGSVAMGDTISDSSMLQYADIPIMFNASRTLTNHGKPLGWLRVNEVKDQVTVLQVAPGLGMYVEQEPHTIIEAIRSAA